MKSDWWPGHLSWVRVWLAIVIVGGAFILMHGIGHRWNTETCNICAMMSG